MTRSALPQTLKAHRTRQELTIEALAKLSGVSRAMISKIERGETVPTASTLGKLAEALDVSISQLVGGRKEASALLTRRADQPEFVEPETGFVRRSLSPLYRGRGVDFVRNTLPSGQRAGPFPSHRPGVEEHLFVQSGKLAVSIGDERYELAAGDFLFYPADREHTFEALGRVDAVFFIVIDNTRLR
jgi:transcriptional regulator with XRE-family HTH domain